MKVKDWQSKEGVKVRYCEGKKRVKWVLGRNRLYIAPLFFLHLPPLFSLYPVSLHPFQKYFLPLCVSLPG